MYAHMCFCQLDLMSSKTILPSEGKSNTVCCCLISYSSLTTFMNGSQGEKIKVLASVLIDETLKVSQLSCALRSCPQAMRVKEAVFRWPLCRRAADAGHDGDHSE